MKSAPLAFALTALAACVPYPLTEWRYEAKGDHCAARSPSYLVGGCDDYEVRIEPGIEISPSVSTGADGLEICIGIHSKTQSWQLKSNAISILINDRPAALSAHRISTGIGFTNYYFHYPDNTVRNFSIVSAIVTAEGKERQIPDIRVTYGTRIVVSGTLQ
jgi:hypothetical protein